MKKMTLNNSRTVTCGQHHLRGQFVDWMIPLFELVLWLVPLHDKEWNFLHRLLHRKRCFRHGKQHREATKSFNYTSCLKELSLNPDKTPSVLQVSRKPKTSQPTMMSKPDVKAVRHACMTLFALGTPEDYWHWCLIWCDVIQNVLMK